MHKPNDKYELYGGPGIDHDDVDKTATSKGEDDMYPHFDGG